MDIRTPEEFVDYYTERLRTDLDNQNIQINKLGVIGYILNILGWTQFDTKLYYDDLFKESFPVSSQKDENLYLHSSIYGYIPGFSTPSTAVGNFVFDFNLMPKTAGTIVKREVLFSNIVFKIDDFTFTTKNTYRFIQDGTNYYCIIYDQTGGVQYVPSSSPVISAPFTDVKQVAISDEYIKTSNYSFGSYYAHQFTTDDLYLSNLSVNVEKPGFTYNSEDDWDEFDITYVKQFENAFNEVVFLRTLSSNEYLLEFGSGVRGLYVPNANIKLTKTVTQGLSGNLNVATDGALESSTLCTGVEYNAIGDRFAISGNLKDILSTKFDYSEGGKNPLTGEELRRTLIEFIQTRDNLISETDFYNIANKYIQDFKFLFRKSSFLDNIFYLCRVFRDKYQLPCKSLNYTQHVIDDSISVNFALTEETAGSMSAGDYTYSVAATDNFKSTIITPQTITISDNSSVNISWDSVDNAVLYRVYKYSGGTIVGYFETYDTTLIDDGQDFNMYDSSVQTNKITFYPTFMINNVEFISPFIYEYDSYMNWYNGYILYHNFLVHFNNIENRDDSYDLPVFYFNIKYDINNKKTLIYVKSHQDITNLDINITLHGLNIIDTPVSFVNENTYVYEYSNDKHGVIWDTFAIELKVYSDNKHIVTGMTSNISQVYNISDQLTLLNYEDENNKIHISNIPVVEKEVYESDVNYYLDQIYNFLIGNNFEENRMITDSVQSRFLNTHYIDNLYTPHILLQGYNYNIQFPLKLKVDCTIDSDYTSKNNVDINTEKTNLMLELAKTLQNKYTGTSIKYYNSHIVDLVHTNRPFIKDVIVDITDANGQIIDNGLESKSDLDILKSINDDETLESYQKKLNILGYVPPFWYWDVDTIDLKFLF